MQTHELKRITQNKKKKTVGRGSKRGKTSGRGTKGQNARAGRKKRPEMRDIIKKLPKMRGRGKNSNKSFEIKPAIITLAFIEQHFDKGAIVSPLVLLEKGAFTKIGGRIPGVKILGTGALTKAVTIEGCLVSEAVRATIEKAGGTVPVKKEKKASEKSIKAGKKSTKKTEETPAKKADKKAKK